VQLTITGMRAVMGDMDLDHTLSQRDQINSKLRIILDEATDKWGVKVTRVDVKNINPPEDVRVTMEKQMTAERKPPRACAAGGRRTPGRRHARGRREAGRRHAFEGEKQSAILQAEGLAQARLRQAEAESQAISQVADAMHEHGNPAQYLITTRYIESLRDMTKSNNAKVIFMPVETSTMLSAWARSKRCFPKRQDIFFRTIQRINRRRRGNCVKDWSAGIPACGSRASLPASIRRFAKCILSPASLSLRKQSPEKRSPINGASCLFRFIHPSRKRLQKKETRRLPSNLTLWWLAFARRSM
jgi:hypothetical protein